MKMRLDRPANSSSRPNPKPITISGFRSYVLVLIIGFSTLFGVTIFILTRQNLTHARLYHAQSIAVSVAIVVLFIVLLNLFIRKVYMPILRLEREISRLQTPGNRLEEQHLKDLNIHSRSISLDEMIRLIRISMDRELTAQILKKQAEIDAMQSQINPHFLYNTLEAIRGEALINGVDEIADMTEALSAFFRYSISQKGNIVTIDDELRNVHNYFLIQQYRFNNKFEIVKIIDEDPQLLECIIPKLTIQPIVENSIFHGLETMMGKGKITIRIQSTEKRVIILISDNGIGMDQETLDALNQSLKSSPMEPAGGSDDRHVGIALLNVHQRIKFFFGEPYGLYVSSTPGIGTDVEIVIPRVTEKSADFLAEG